MIIRYFALILGIIFTIIGIAGFIPGLVSVPAGAPDLIFEHSYGYLFGLFPVNVLHNLVHLAFGLWGLVAYRRMDRSRTYARSLALIYGLFALLGLFPQTHTLFGLVPMFAHDVWLHAVIAFAAAYVGFAHERVERQHPGGTPLSHH